MADSAGTFYAPTTRLFAVRFADYPTPLDLSLDLIHFATDGYLSSIGIPSLGKWAKLVATIALREQLRFLEVCLPVLGMAPARAREHIETHRKSIEQQIDAEYWNFPNSFSEHFEYLNSRAPDVIKDNRIALSVFRCLWYSSYPMYLLKSLRESQRK